MAKEITINLYIIYVVCLPLTAELGSIAVFTWTDVDDTTNSGDTWTDVPGAPANSWTPVDDTTGSGGSWTPV